MKRRLLILLALGTFSAIGVGYGAFSLHQQPLDSTHVSASLSAGTASAPIGLLSDASDVGGGYDLSAHKTLSRVIILIKENYVDPARLEPYQMFLAALDYIEKTVAEVMVDDSEAPAKITVAVGTARHEFDLERLGGLDQLWEVSLALRDIFSFLQRHLDDPEQRRDVEYAAINGMLSTLDPHSVLLKPESFNEVKLSTKGEFGGLGIVISIRDASLTVISPIEDTPAARAGLNALDKIVKINEESTVNMSLEEAVQRLRGKPGSKVTIWIKRKKWTEAKKFVLTRSIIKIQSVTSKLLADRVGYVKVKSFQANTFDDLHSHLEGLRAQAGDPLKGVILDLRNNPGGLLDQAILISDQFISRGPLVITVGEGNRKREVKSAHASGTDTDYPLAVLVNGGSASASEIVSGAVKNHNRGVIIGEQTFGKGSVQVLYDFKDRSALKLTIAQYLTPGDISIQSKGISPDIEIAHAAIAEKDVRLFVHDLSPREKDLDHHLDTPEVVSANGNVDEAIESKRSVKLVHLEPQVDTDADPVQVETDSFKMDYEIELAHRILKNAETTDRVKMLEQSRGLLKKSASEEQAKISGKLKDLGVDWAEGHAERADARVVLSTNATRGMIAAGNSLLLKAKVSNTGKTPIYRAYGVTDSENPLLRNLEFVFGRIEPGQTRSWTVEIKLPQDMSSRADAVTLRVRDMNDVLQGVQSSLVLSIREKKKPRFSFRYSVDDRASGNGDGVLQFGEKISLRVGVTNRGEGTSEEALVALKNMSHGMVTLKQGRAKIGELSPGESEEAALKFSVKQPGQSHSFDGQPIKTDRASLRVSVWDAILGEVVSETIEIPVSGKRSVKRERRMLKVPNPGNVPIYGGASPKARVIGHASAGMLLRSDGVTSDGWRRVALKGGQIGFVRNEATKISPSSKKSPANPLALNPDFVSPAIQLDVEEFVTSSPTYRLRGSLGRHSDVRDVFVFLNDKKVFYRSFVEEPDPKRDARLDLSLSLKDGSNSVVVVARKSDDLISRRLVGLYRSSAEAVAEHQTASSNRSR